MWIYLPSTCCQSAPAEGVDSAAGACYNNSHEEPTKTKSGKGAMETTSLATPGEPETVGEDVCGPSNDPKGNRKGPGSQCQAGRNGHEAIPDSPAKGGETVSGRAAELLVEREERAGYQAKHLRVQTLKGKPKKCEVCGTTNPTKTYEWANLTGDFDNPKDYRRMCRSCHRNYDNARR